MADVIFKFPCRSAVARLQGIGPDNSVCADGWSGDRKQVINAEGADSQLLSHDVRTCRICGTQYSSRSNVQHTTLTSLLHWRSPFLHGSHIIGAA